MVPFCCVDTVRWYQCIGMDLFFAERNGKSDLPHPIHPRLPPIDLVGMGNFNVGGAMLTHAILVLSIYAATHAGGRSHA